MNDSSQGDGFLLSIAHLRSSLDGDALLADMIVSRGNNVIYAAERELEQFIINLIELIQLIVLQ